VLDRGGPSRSNRCAKMTQGSAHVSSAHAPPPDEPKSPLWLPALGGALFLAVGLWWAVTPSSPDPVDVADAPVASAAPAAPTAPPPAPSAAAPQMRPTMPPSGSAPPPGMRMGARGPGGAPAGSADPAAIQRLLDQMKKH
jgi:hypothetical protein